MLNFTTPPCSGGDYPVPPAPGVPPAHHDGHAAGFRIGQAARAVCRMACRDGSHAVRLRGPWDVLGLLLPTLGRVRVLIGAADWACGRTVCFANDCERPATTGDVIAARDIECRWHYGFAVAEEKHGLMFCSLQFFDAAGRSVHRIYLTDESNVLAWSRLVTCFRAPVQ